MTILTAPQAAILSSSLDRPARGFSSWRRDFLTLCMRGYVNRHEVGRPPYVTQDGYDALRRHYQEAR